VFDQRRRADVGRGGLAAAVHGVLLLPAAAGDPVREMVGRPGAAVDGEAAGALECAGSTIRRRCCRVCDRFMDVLAARSTGAVITNSWRRGISTSARKT